MENIELKLESIDPTGVAIESKTIHMPIYGEESMVKRRLILHIGECLYRVDDKGYINEIFLPIIPTNDDDSHSPYCEICSGCGEDGCCSPINCTMEDGCKYGETYLKSLKEDYLFVREFYEKIYPKLDDVMKKEVDELYMNIEV